MKIPDKVRIGSMDYKVVLTDKMLLKDGNARCYGHINFEQHEIEIDKSLGDTQGHEQVLLHEVIHGILEDRSVNLRDYPDEEIIVDELAKGLHQVIRDNPEMFK